MDFESCLEACKGSTIFGFGYGSRCYGDGSVCLCGCFADPCEPSAFMQNVNLYAFHTASGEKDISTG